MYHWPAFYSPDYMLWGLFRWSDLLYKVDLFCKSGNVGFFVASICKQICLFSTGLVLSWRSQQSPSMARGSNSDDDYHMKFGNNAGAHVDAYLEYKRLAYFYCSKNKVLLIPWDWDSVNMSRHFISVSPSVSTVYVIAYTNKVVY